MYKTCIHCNRTLGDNETVENFPIGRRLAFDAEKGRLWVVCNECRQWNLTPLEERWEAIEECEKHFRDTPRRLSTDNIGLARTGEGLDLVRVGKPLRPEYAAWRYGRQFLARRVAVEAAWVMHAFVAAYDAWVAQLTGGEKQRVVTRVSAPDGTPLPLTRYDLRGVRLIKAAELGGWTLSVPHRTGLAKIRWWQEYVGKDVDIIELTGPAAQRAAARILPKLNPFGGNERQVGDAARLIEEVGSPDRLFAARSIERGRMRSDRFFDVEASVLKTMRPAERLALEMAAQEEAERRAFEGELAQLEAAWREAEQIAAIADRLLIPEEIDTWIRSQRDSE